MFEVLICARFELVTLLIYLFDLVVLCLVLDFDVAVVLELELVVEVGGVVRVIFERERLRLVRVVPAGRLRERDLFQLLRAGPSLFPEVDEGDEDDC